MILKAILAFLILTLVILGIPSGWRLYKEAGGTKKFLLKIGFCGILSVLALTILVMLF